jgi:hypothetical protein
MGADWEKDFERQWKLLFRPDEPLSKIPSQTRTSYPFKLEDVVRGAIADLRKELGKVWISSNSIYGTRLHAALRQRLAKVTSPTGWSIVVDSTIRSMGLVSADLLSLTVEQYLNGPGAHLDWLRPQLTSELLHSRIGDIKPDLMMRGPDGVTTIWDLTSRERDEHVAKTLLYANLLSRDNHLTRIGETYWLKFR